MHGDLAEGRVREDPARRAPRGERTAPTSSRAGRPLGTPGGPGYQQDVTWRAMWRAAGIATGGLAGGLPPMRVRFGMGSDDGTFAPVEARAF